MADADKANILLVDDQPGKLLSYEAMLSGLGETLIPARSAREALNHLLNTDVAVVLIDVCMPELDGFELAAMMREHPRFQQTPIIFVSGVHLTEFDRLKGYACGAVDYVPVPVVPEILRAKVSVFVELFRKTRELERLNRELEQRVAERTAELQAVAADLRDREEALREADRSKDEFLAVLAHEIRNPLAPIRTAVHLLRLKELSDAQRAKAREVIERQVEHLVQAHRRPAGRRPHHARRHHAAARARGSRRGRRAGRRNEPPAHRRAAARARRRAAGTAADGRRRHDPAQSGHRQSVEQRRQVHRYRRASGSARRERGRRSRHPRAGQRHGHFGAHAARRCSICSRRRTMPSTVSPAAWASVSRWSAVWSTCTAGV